MSRKKLERQLNLAMCLMATTRYLSVDEIADLVPGYVRDGTPDGETAFRRMFERDKAELRELGIPVETGGVTGWDDEVGYRIQRRDYALPDLHLTPGRSGRARARGPAVEQRLAGRAQRERDAQAARRRHRSAAAAGRARAAGRGHGGRLRALPGCGPRGAGATFRLSPARAAAGRGRAGASLGRRLLARALVPRRASTWTAARAGCSGSAGWSRACGRSGPPGVVTVPPDVDLRAAVEAPIRASHRRSAVVRVRPGCRLGAAARRPQPGPDARHRSCLTDRDVGRHRRPGRRARCRRQPGRLAGAGARAAAAGCSGALHAHVDRGTGGVA